MRDLVPSLRLDNTAVGHRAILENFGQSALPNVTWQIGAW